MVTSVSSSYSTAQLYQEQLTQQSPPKQAETNLAQSPQDTVHLSGAAQASLDADHDGDRK